MFTRAEVDDLIATGNFPELIGLRLAGGDMFQLWDVNVVGEGGVDQTFVFQYDEALLGPQDLERRLRIAHFVDGRWESPRQIRNPDANTITVTVDHLSPFALASVPLPPAIYMFVAGLAALGVRWQRKRCQ